MDTDTLTVIGIVVTIVGIIIGIIQLSKKSNDVTMNSNENSNIINSSPDVHIGDTIHGNKYGGDNVHGNKEVHYHNKKE
ncbi:hypothetical protein ACN2CX_07865 [Aliarcobacter butzleri]|uniref:hypothetical protein n=1 Tax=Aliarcobacter butzleri TaxID=28197 RepID=UPI003AFA1524